MRILLPWPCCLKSLDDVEEMMKQCMELGGMDTGMVRRTGVLDPECRSSTGAVRGSRTE